MESDGLLLQLVQILKVNQVDWPGKARQHILYDVYQANLTKEGTVTQAV